MERVIAAITGCKGYPVTFLDRNAVAMADLTLHAADVAALERMLRSTWKRSTFVARNAAVIAAAAFAAKAGA